MTADRLIDWQQVTLNLRSNYGPLSRIAREIGAGPVHLQRLARGEIAEPKFTIGIRLLDLHFDVVGDRHVEIRIGPMRREQ